MLDYDAIKNMFDRLGIQYTLQTLDASKDEIDGIRITVETGTPKVDGHTGFFTDFVFDPKGNLLKLGLWE
jgi:hypothetical protein